MDISSGFQLLFVIDQLNHLQKRWKNFSKNFKLFDSDFLCLQANCINLQTIFPFVGTWILIYCFESWNKLVRHESVGKTIRSVLASKHRMSAYFIALIMHNIILCPCPSNLNNVNTFVQNEVRYFLKMDMVRFIGSNTYLCSISL